MWLNLTEPKFLYSKEVIPFSLSINFIFKNSFRFPERNTVKKYSVSIYLATVSPVINVLH